MMTRGLPFWRLLDRMDPARIRGGMHQKIGIGVIGCGHWGPNHIRSFASLPQSRVLAAADPDKSRIQELKKLYPAVQFTRNYREILRNKAVDAVIVATPTSLHAKVAQEALQAGKHVLVEKPLCTSVAEGTALLRHAKKNGCILMVGQVFLFNNGILKL